MVAFAQPKETAKYPWDTGGRFNGVKVRLECDSRRTAHKLGRTLQAKGLPWEPPEMMLHTRLTGQRVPLGREHGQIVHLCWPTQASGNIVVLETTDSMLIEPFLRWLRSVYPKPAEQAAGDVTTLNQLADSGEIEVIDCG